MMKCLVGLSTTVTALSWIIAASVSAAEFSAEAAHEPFMTAFNDRNWEQVKSALAEDAVFHRANSDEVQTGPDEIVGHFSDLIGNPEEWNVKFARLDSEDQTVGKDGRVVERGDFAITAGGDDSACYAGSYMATWAPANGQWKLQVFSWQDVETDMEACQ